MSNTDKLFREFSELLNPIGEDGRDYEIAVFDEDIADASVLVFVSNPDRQPNSTRPLGVLAVRWDTIRESFIINTDDDEDQGFRNLTPTQTESFSLGLQLAVKIAEALNSKYAKS